MTVLHSLAACVLEANWAMGKVPRGVFISGQRFRAELSRETPLPTYQFFGEGSSPTFTGGRTYVVCCEKCKARLGLAGEALGPPEVGGLTVREIESRLQRMAMPAANLMQAIQDHERTCPALKWAKGA